MDGHEGRRKKSQTANAIQRVMKKKIIEYTDYR